MLITIVSFQLSVFLASDCNIRDGAVSGNCRCWLSDFKKMSLYYALEDTPSELKYKSIKSIIRTSARHNTSIKNSYASVLFQIQRDMFGIGGRISFL